jgi:hypothetical protein
VSESGREAGAAAQRAKCEPPLTRWTTPEPAKSVAPQSAKRSSSRHALNIPEGDQPAWTTTGYTKLVRATEMMRYAVKEMRSATAPETMVAAVAQKAHWNSHMALSYMSMSRKNESVPMNELLSPAPRAKP